MTIIFMIMSLFKTHCSDAKLVSNEGREFHVHRLVLCGQSPVFRSMLQSEHWASDRQEGNKVHPQTLLIIPMTIMNADYASI